jgi:cobalt-zinc-cadmium efflux system outer membrane protein
VLGTTPPAPAAAADLPLTLSLEEATARALTESPTYRVAQTEVTRAEGARLDVEPLFPTNPVLDADAGPRKQGTGDDASTKASYQLRFQQRINLPGQRSARLEAADAAVELARTRLKAVAAEVRARVRNAYIGALVANRRTQYTEQQVAFLTRAYDAAVARAESGASSDIDRRLAESEFGLAQVSRARAMADAQRALQELRSVLNVPYDRIVQMSSTLQRPKDRPVERERFLETARARRRDLVALRQEGKAIDAEIERLRTERLPVIAVGLTGEQDSPREYWAGPNISIAPPVWQRQQAALAVAAADRQRQRIALDAAEQAAARDLLLACDLVERRREEVTLYEDTVLPATERTRDLVFEGWRAGKFDIFRVLVAERDLVNSRLNYLESLATLWGAETEIDRALGIIDEVDK